MAAGPRTVQDVFNEARIRGVSAYDLPRQHVRRAPELRREVETLLATGAGAGDADETTAPDRWRAETDAGTERAGSVIGAYTLREIIGEGGMGTVFRAEQTHPIQRTVAL